MNFNLIQIFKKFGSTLVRFSNISINRFRLSQVFGSGNDNLYVDPKVKKITIQQRPKRHKLKFQMNIKGYSSNKPR